jgi:hypothetical protein
VHHAHPEYLDDIDGHPVKHCVALKEVKEMRDDLKNEIGILKEFARLENQQRRHLVKLYQTFELIILPKRTKKIFIFQWSNEKMAFFWQRCVTSWNWAKFRFRNISKIKLMN